jgi:aspartokinase
METVSSSVKRIISNKPYLHEAMARGIVSYGHLAEQIRQEISLALDKEVKQSAVVMALRRYAEELRSLDQRPGYTRIEYELLMKTNIYDVNLKKSPRALEIIRGLYTMVALDRGDFLNITVGNNELSIAVSDKYRHQLDQLLEGEIFIHQISDLVALTLLFSGDFLHTPGVVYEAVRNLSWNSINVYEIISTMNELTFVIDRSDSTHAYEVLQSFLS